MIESYNNRLIKPKLATSTRIINISIFLFAILTKGLGDALIVTKDPNSAFNLVKYIILILGIFIMSYELKERNKFHKIKNIYRQEFQYVIIGLIFIAFLSLSISLYNGYFVFRTIKELIFLSVPVIFAFLVLNLFSYREILFCAKISTIIFLISFILEVGVHYFTPALIIDTMKNISFAGGDTGSSTTVFESNFFCDPAMALFCFFAYYKEKNKTWMWLSFLFVLLANKRLMILFSLIILAIVHIPKIEKILNKKVNKNIYFLLALGFTILPIFIRYSMRPAIALALQNFLGINMADFWMGRDVMVNAMANRGFISYGLGSTFDFQGSLLEVEGVKFLLELGIPGLAAIAFSYWRLPNYNLYCMIVMLYNFLNMNTSTSLMTGAFSWIFYILLFGCVNYKYEEEKVYS